MRLPEQQVTGNIFSLKFSESFQQPAHHKPVLAQRGLQKIRDQAKHYRQRLLSANRLLLRMQQGPVIRRPLVAAHPVHNRACQSVASRFQNTHPLRIHDCIMRVVVIRCKNTPQAPLLYYRLHWETVASFSRPGVFL